MTTKSEIVELIKRGITHEAFTHEWFGTFDVTLMRQAAQRGEYELVTIPCYPDLEPVVQFLMTARDWEAGRVWQLMCDESFYYDPVMLIIHPDGKHTLVDGIHRLLARYVLRCPNAPAYMVPEAKAIRPPADMSMLPDTWGRYWQDEHGRLFDRETGAEINGGERGGSVSSR